MTYTAHNPFVVSRLPAALVLTIGSALFPAVPQAQQEPPPDTENVEVTGSDSSTVRYQVGFFDQYNPNTVDDMLDWIPGISLALDGGGGGGGGDDGGRGLGGEENILINGQRMAGKSNNPRDQLSRIPAEEVDYIEIIRGSATDLGVRSSGQIVNVVLTGELNRSSSDFSTRAKLSSAATGLP